MSLFCTTLYLLFSDVVATLVQWTFEGLTVEKAMKQPKTAYIIRHLKMGIRMAGSMCGCSKDIASKMMVNIQNLAIPVCYVSPLLLI